MSIDGPLRYNLVGSIWLVILMGSIDNCRTKFRPSDKDSIDNCLPPVAPHASAAVNVSRHYLSA